MKHSDFSTVFPTTARPDGTAVRLDGGMKLEDLFAASALPGIIQAFPNDTPSAWATKAREVSESMMLLKLSKKHFEKARK